MKNFTVIKKKMIIQQEVKYVKINIPNYILTLLFASVMMIINTISFYSISIMKNLDQPIEEKNTKIQMMNQRYILML